MNRRVLAVVVALVLTSLALGATVFREQVARAAPGIQDVFVTNSTREPVPVHEQGTAAVNVTNAPLAVRESGETPVQRHLEWDFNKSCDSQGNAAIYQVPAGKYLRIEQVTFAQSATVDHIEWFRVDTFLPGGAAKHNLEHTRTGVSQLVRIYAGGGNNAVFRLRFDGCPGGLWFGSFSGVLVDAPGT